MHWYVSLGWNDDEEKKARRYAASCCAAGLRFERKSAARCACEAAVKIARLSFFRTVSQLPI
jgi:hypothetical protein